MTDDPLSPHDITSMTVPAWEQAKDAVRAGDPDRAIELIDAAVARWQSLQHYSIDWITSLLSFIGRQYGEDAVEEAMRATGDDVVRPRRDPGWASLPAAVRAKAIARAMVANFGECEVSEDEDKVVLSFRCGSGGRLIDGGRYDAEGGPFLTLRQPGDRTFQRAALPVYCAHCSINNEIQPVEWGQPPTTVEFPPARPGEPCVHHIYRDTSAIPDEVYARIGKRRPEPPQTSAPR